MSATTATPWQTLLIVGMEHEGILYHIKVISYCSLIGWIWPLTSDKTKTPPDPAVLPLDSWSAQKIPLEKLTQMYCPPRCYPPPPPLVPLAYTRVDVCCNVRSITNRTWSITWPTVQNTKQLVIRTKYVKKHSNRHYKSIVHTSRRHRHYIAGRESVSRATSRSQKRSQSAVQYRRRSVSKSRLSDRVLTNDSKLAYLIIDYKCVLSVTPRFLQIHLSIICSELNNNLLK